MSIMDKILGGREPLDRASQSQHLCLPVFQVDNNFQSTLMFLSSVARLVEKTDIVMWRSVVNNTLRSHIAI